MKKSILIGIGIIVASVFACMNQVNAAGSDDGDEAVPEEIFPTEPILCVSEDGENEVFPEKPFPIEPVLCGNDNEGDG